MKMAEEIDSLPPLLHLDLRGVHKSAMFQNWT